MVRRIEDLTAVGQERQREVGAGNRFATRSEPVRGLGETLIPVVYLNVDEIESALENLAAAYPA